MIGLAIKHSVVIEDEMVLMIDIGGGSVEFIIGNREDFVYYNSLKLGVARMAATFVDSDPIEVGTIKKLKNHYSNSLIEVIELAKQHGVKTIIGSSGTMENIAEMIAGRNDITAARTLNELTFKKDSFIDFYHEIIKLDKKGRLKEKNLEEI